MQEQVMEPSENYVAGDGSPEQHSTITNDQCELQPENSSIIEELESLRLSYRNLEIRLDQREEEFIHALQQKQEALQENAVIKEAFDEVVKERDLFRDEVTKEKNFSRKCMEELAREKREGVELFTKNLELVKLVKDRLASIFESLDEDGSGKFPQECGEKEAEIGEVLRLVSIISSKFHDFKDVWSKEKQALEDSVQSLTEENRDLNSFLRIAVLEKETVEKSLSKLKCENEQKRLAIVQMAERGLQKVGFGFIMGSGHNEQLLDNLDLDSGIQADDREPGEETISLASAVENTMKSLRQEITELRRSLQEYRSEIERQQTIAEMQDQNLSDKTCEIKELKGREAKLMQNVEALLLEIKETEEDATRWREACEMEVKAGKKAIQDRERLISILRQELGKAKAGLEVANGKLRLKEELVGAAVAAREAVERSLRLADSRASGLCERMEDLMKQLEESEKKRRSGNGRRMRYICWPFNVEAVAYGNGIRNRNVKRMIPEMQALD